MNLTSFLNINYGDVMYKFVFVFLLLIMSFFSSAKECVLLQEEVPHTVITGDGPTLTCVDIPNAYSSAEMRYVAVNSSFYAPKVSYRTGRETLVNITPDSNSPVSKSYISGRTNSNFKLYVGDSPLKYKTTTFERVPHEITFVLTYQSGKPFVLVSINMMNKISSAAGSQSTQFQDDQSFLYEQSVTPFSASIGCDSTNTSPIDMPQSANLNNNIFIARQIRDMLASEVGGDAIKYYWFYITVRNGAQWDYKQINRRYQEFGNYNYGATGAALGIPRDVLMRAAGAAQLKAGTSEREWGFFLGNAPYGDDPVDQEWINKGINYYNEIFSNKTTSQVAQIGASTVDSCRTRNDRNQTRGDRSDNLIDNGGNGLYRITLDTGDVYVRTCFVYNCGEPNVDIKDLEREEEKDR